MKQKITSYDEIQKFDVKKQRWASHTDTRTFKNEFAVSELVETSSVRWGSEIFQKPFLY